MQRKAKHILIVLVVFFSTQLKAQEYFKISDNGQFFVTATLSNTDSRSSLEPNLFNVDVYSIRQQCKVTSFAVRSAQKELHSIEISSNGAILYLKESDKSGKIYSVRTGQKIDDIAGKTVALSHYSDFYLVIHRKSIKSYSIVNGGEIKEYKYTRRGNVINFYVSKNDEYFIATSSKKQSQLWRLNKSGPVKKIYASDIKFNYQDSIITGINKTGGNIVVSQYSMRNYQKINKLESAKVFKGLIKEKKLNDTLNTRFVYKLNPTNTKLSSKGGSVALGAINEEGKKGILVLDVLTKELKTEVINDNEKSVGIDYLWMNDSILLLTIDNFQKQVFNTKTSHYSDDLNYKFEFEKGDYSTTEKRQIKNRIISPNQRYCILPFKKKGVEGLYLKPTAIRQEKSLITDVKYYGLDENSKYIFVKKDKQIGFVKTEDIEMDLSQGELPLNPFSDSCNLGIESILGEPAPPPKFKYPRLTGQKHISEKSDKDTVQMVFKSMVMEDSTVELQVQLMDENGIYYYGASDADWKHVWCNLILKQAGKPGKQLDNFSVSEVTDNEPPKVAMSIVMDFSGSMGNKRINNLITGVEKLANSKREQDAISIIKYDHRVKVEQEVTNDSYDLFKNATKTPYADLSGGTALLDGIAAGVNQLKHLEGYHSKIVILLTDGNENSSKISKNRVVMQAKRNGIKVFTIGLGNFVSEAYLKGISFNTEGSNYKIFNSSDLNWIYDDIYKKANNYYSVKFKPDTMSKQKMNLKLCLEPYADTLTTVFDNRKIDYGKIDLDGDTGFSVPFDEAELTLEEKEEIGNIPDIIDFSKVITFQKEFKDEPLDTLENFPPKSKMEKDFEALTLPYFEFVFDKTKITNNPQKEINQLLAFLRKYQDAALNIVGHTDNRGGHDYNMKLSLNRAKKVREILIKNGVKPERLIPYGLGDTEPISTNDTDEGRQKNRRVVFEVIE